MKNLDLQKVIHQPQTMYTQCSLKMVISLLTWFTPNKFTQHKITFIVNETIKEQALKMIFGKMIGLIELSLLLEAVLTTEASDKE